MLVTGNYIRKSIDKEEDMKKREEDNLRKGKDEYILCSVFPSKEVEERAFEVVRKLYEKEKEGKR